MSVRRLKLLEPMVGAKGEELVHAMVAKPMADLVADLAFPLLAYAGLGLLGFPEEDFEQIKAWAGNRAQLTYGRLTADEQVQAARDVVDFWRFCDQFVARRAEDLRDDFTSDMIRLHQEDPDTPDLNGSGQHCVLDGDGRARNHDELHRQRGADVVVPQP